MFSQTCAMGCVTDRSKEEEGMTPKSRISRLISIQVIILGFLITSPNLTLGSMTFDLLEAGTSNKTVTVLPGGSIALGVVASNMTAEVSAAAELDAFTYRIVFSNEEFSLVSNVFGTPFDNTCAPTGFNGSIPWASGAAVPITNWADAGSPKANILVADLYRTTASEAGKPATNDTVVETLGLVAPQTPGVYTINLQIIEAVDKLGVFHTVSVGSAFNVNVVSSSECHDLASFAPAYGSVSGNTNYSSACDFDNDSDVDGSDLAKLAVTF